MSIVSMIAIDLAKSVFHLHGVDGDGGEVFRRRLRRAQLHRFMAVQPRCLVAMEACAGAHEWARQFTAMGHEVRLIPPVYVKPFVRRQKNDANDAAAIAEAARRPAMRFVAVKSVEAQATRTLHRVREQLIRQRTAGLNALRSHLAEFGVIAPRGAGFCHRLAVRVLRRDFEGVPEQLYTALAPLARTLVQQDAEISELDREIHALARTDPVAQRLMTIPGIGPVTASALVATLGDARAFRSGRELAAFLGLVPRQHSSGGVVRLRQVSKMGDAYLRRLLTLGARAVLAHAGRSAKRGGRRAQWVRDLKRTKPFAVAASALANKMARIVFALLRGNDVYRDHPHTA